MSKKNISRTDLSSLANKYQRFSVVSEIEKNLFSAPGRTFRTSSLVLSDVFDEANYDLSVYSSLEESLRRDGFLVPLIVVKGEGKEFEIINGVKRFLLGRKIGMKEMPCVMANLTPERKYAYIVENIQTEMDVVLVKSHCFTVLENKYGYTTESLSSLSGLSIHQIKNIMRLEELPEFLKDAIRSFKLSYAQGRTLLGLPVEKQKELYERIQKEKISVRQLEQEKRKYLGIQQKRKISLQGRKITLTFDSEEEAKKAYLHLKKEFAD